MMAHLKQLMLLVAVLLVVNIALPAQDDRKLAGGLDAVSTQTKTATYHKGDGQGAVSETDDGTITSRYAEGTLGRFSEYQGDGTENSLQLKRVVNTSGGETLNETKRVVIKFPNIIGNEAGKIPLGVKIVSSTLRLVLNTFSSYTSALNASVYFVLEDWTETESGYLKSPGWRYRYPVENESDTTNKWTNLGADTPTSSESPPIKEAVQIPYIIGNTISFDVTKAVQAWVDGKPNNGVMLKLFQEAPGGTLRLAGFYSSEWSEVGLRPKLEVVYEVKVVSLPPTPAPTLEAVSTSSAPAPLVPPPPMPTPTIKPEQAPSAPKSAVAPTLKPMPAPMLVPPSAESEKPAAPSTPLLEPERRPKPDFVQNIFIVIQRSILATWAKIIELIK